MGNGLDIGFVWNDTDKAVTYSVNDTVIVFKDQETQINSKFEMKYGEKDKNFIKQTKQKIIIKKTGQKVTSFVKVYPHSVLNVGLTDITKGSVYLSIWVGDKNEVEELFYQNQVIKTEEDMRIKVKYQKGLNGQKKLSYRQIQKQEEQKIRIMLSKVTGQDLSLPK